MKAKKDTACFPLPEPFSQIIIALMAGMVFEHRKHLIAQFLIEAWCLKIVGVEDHMLTPTGSRFLLCSLEEFCPYPMFSQALLDPERTEIPTATPGPAFDSSTEALLVV